MSGHTKWSELRDRVFAEHPGMAERVAAQVEQEVAQLPKAEAWEIELEAEPAGDPPIEESFRQELVEAVCDGTEVLDADIDLSVKDGKLVLLAVLMFAAVGLREASKRFSQAGRSADILRRRLESYGSVVQQTIRRAA